MALERQHGIVETHGDISTVDIKKIETKDIQEHKVKIGSLLPRYQKRSGVTIPNKQ